MYRVHGDADPSFIRHILAYLFKLVKEHHDYKNECVTKVWHR